MSALLGEDDPLGQVPELTSIGRYSLAFQLAEGGMASVYLACVKGPGGFEKVVALKRIHPHLAKQRSYVEMFLDEARIASRIGHPNVCGVLDFGEADGEYYIVMEYLVGEPMNKVLRELARRHRELDLSRWPRHLAFLAAQAADGLHAAHELEGHDGRSLEIVHRDVSPQNLFVGYDGHLRVVDFGIARAADRIHKTESGAVKGKWAYMAPEQIAQGQIDRRTDVFALGVVMYEALTLRRLFRRDTNAETMYAILETDAPAPSRHNPHVPPELDAIVLRALHRDPAQRYQDALSVARDLRRYLRATDAVEPIDASVIAGEMDALFPGQHAAKRNLMKRAADHEIKVPERIPGESDSASFSGVDDGDAFDRDEPSRRWQVPVLVGLVLLLAVISGALGAMVFLTRGETDAPVAQAQGAESADSVAEDLSPDETTPGDAPRDDTATDDTALDDTALDDTALDDTALDDTATDDTALDDTALDDTALDDTALDDTATDGSDPSTGPGSDVETDLAPLPPRRRRRRDTVRAPAPTEPGTLVIVTPGGWANVYRGRRLLGQTPLRRELEPGTYELSLRMLGQPPPIPITVEVTSGEVTRVSRRLD